MNKDLPKVYANKIDKEINNDQEVFYESSENEINSSDRSIRLKINDILSSSNFVYKKDVTIITDKETFNTTIVGTNNGYLLTMDNKRIDINEIKDIKKI